MRIEETDERSFENVRNPIIGCERKTGHGGVKTRYRIKMEKERRRRGRD